MTSASSLAVVGGGIVGLAVARQYLIDHPGATVEVFEKEPGVARHQTGRNSGVVHAGIYYAPGSEKSVLCRRGVSLLREFCVEHDLGYEECGKLVVARDHTEIDRLERLQERAEAAGVPRVERLGPDGIEALEPEVVGVEAIHSPTTAIVDYSAIAHAIAADVVASGGAVTCSTAVRSIVERSGGVDVVVTDGGARRFDRVVVCAGLQSDRVARAAGAPSDPRIVPFRGEYFELRPRSASLVNGLVYPVPDPRHPFLGVHFTRRIDGRVDVGPNAVLALSREGYRWRDVSARDLGELLTWPGSWRLARNNWRTGIDELSGSLSKRVFVSRARSYVPALDIDDLVPMPSGVRAQAVDRSGALLDDFVIQREGPVVAVRNAPSPAATASLAIAERVCSEFLDAR